MIATIGKHKGKSIELLVLKEPDYVKWVIEKQDVTGPLFTIKKEAERLITIFDDRAFLVKCMHCKNKLATRVSLYQNSSNLYWWCEKCDPYSHGATVGKLSFAHTYKQLLNHVNYSCGGSKSDYHTIIREMAELKGLPKRVGKKQAEEFFKL
jgi:hypothetical protein